MINVKPKHNQCGATMVEFLFVALCVLGPLTAFVVDFGQMFNAYNVLTRAAQQGALAVASSKDHVPVIQSALVGDKLDYTKATIIVITDSAGEALGSKVTVNLKYDLSGLVFFPWPDFIMSLSSIEATSTVRHF